MMSAESLGINHKDNVGKERIKEVLFFLLALCATLIGIISLAALLVYVFWDALGWLDWQFITSPPSRLPEQAGVYPSLLGSVFLITLISFFSLPLGVGAAVYLEEYTGESILKKIIEMNIANLAGIPSIIFGLLGLGLFVSTLGLPHGTVIVGAFTLSLRILPIIIIASQEAMRAVPASHRQAALGLGATRWQMIRSVVLTESLPGIMTGTIIALANAMGETAPLIMVGVATTIFTAPRSIWSSFSALPLQIFAWSDQPQYDFRHGVAPAAIVVLLIILLALNGVAIYLRQHYTKKSRL